MKSLLIFGDERMGQVLIAYRNNFDTATVSGGSWSAELPIENLAARQPSLVARSTNADPADTRFIADFGDPKPVSFLALLRHNLTQNGRWRVTLSQDAAFEDVVHDSGVIDIWPTIQPFGQGLWGEFNWGGRLLADEAVTYGIAAFELIAQPVIARFVLIELIDPQNPSGYLEAGRLLVGPAWRPSINLQYGWSIEQVDTSRRVKSRGGQTYVDVQPKYRRLRFSIDYLERDEMFGNAYEMERLKGTGGDLFVMIDPDDPIHRHRHSVYGVLQDNTPILNPIHNRYSKSFTIEELL
jgi:hypothetical protein